LVGGVIMFFDRAMYAPLFLTVKLQITFPSQACNGQCVSSPPSILLHFSNITNTQKILFLIGLTIIIGPQKTALFFARRQKLKGTAAFFGGLFLILMRWALIGFLVELYGIFILFGDFLGTIAGFARNIPVIGPWIGMLVDRAGVGVRGSELPV
jgi:hypothetical protein